MKTLTLRPLTVDGDELDMIPLEEFAIAGEWDEEGLDNQEIIARVAALYTSLLTILRDHQAVPVRGRTWLKLALGEALLHANEAEGDVVVEVVVRAREEGEDDE